MKVFTLFLRERDTPSWLTETIPDDMLARHAPLPPSNATPRSFRRAPTAERPWAPA